MASAGLGWLARTKGRSSTDPPLLLTLEFPATVTFAAAQSDSIRISPDGRLLVFTGQSKEGVRQLWIRLHTIALDGTWSEQGNELVAQGRLRAVGRPSAATPGAPTGAAEVPPGAPRPPAVVGN